MKRILISAEQLKENASQVINQAICQASDGATICLEAGEYPLSSPILIEEIKNLTFDGGGSTLRPFFDRTKDQDHGTDVMHCARCANLLIKNFKVCASQSANTAVRILDANLDYADVEVHAREPFCGKENFDSGMTFTEDGRPLRCYWIKGELDPAKRAVIAGEIAVTSPLQKKVPYEEIGPQQYRIYSTSLREHGFGQVPTANSVAVLRKGMFGCIKHSVYGNTAFVFRDCEGVTVEDVKITNFGGFAFIVLPRCFDFTFRRVRIQTEDFEHQPYSITGDGIHTTGLGGKFIVEDCFFERLGDDAINLHTQVISPREITANGARLIYDKIKGMVNDSWAKAGDRLTVRRAGDWQIKGEIPVKAYEKGYITFDPLPFTLEESDVITNQAYFADAIVRRTTVRQPRARAFCWQSVNSLLVEDCFFDSVGDVALYFSSAFRHFLEAGPVKNVVIRRNRFLGNHLKNNTRGMIHAWIFGEEEEQALTHIHQNITVQHNVFEDAALPIYITMTDGVTITDNLFINRREEKDSRIQLKGCNDVLCERNYTLCGAEKFESLPFEGGVRAVNNGYIKFLNKKN